MNDTNVLERAYFQPLCLDNEFFEGMYGIDTDNHHQEWKKGKVMQGWPVKLSKSIEKKKRGLKKRKNTSSIGVKGFISTDENGILSGLYDIIADRAFGTLDGAMLRGQSIRHARLCVLHRRGEQRL